MTSSGKLRGYVLTGPDNDASLFSAADKSPAFCAECHCLLDKSYLPESIALGKALDVSSTYDNRLIVSERFADYVQRNWTEGLVLTPIKGRGRNYFVLSSNRVLRFDASARGTRFEEKCGLCGQHAVVVGATPVYLVDAPHYLAEGFHRTDIEFGSKHGKAPLILIGPETGRAMETQRFKGLDVMRIMPS